MLLDKGFFYFRGLYIKSSSFLADKIQINEIRGKSKVTYQNTHVSLFLCAVHQLPHIPSLRKVVVNVRVSEQSLAN